MCNSLTAETRVYGENDDECRNEYGEYQTVHERVQHTGPQIVLVLVEIGDRYHPQQIAEEQCAQAQRGVRKLKVRLVGFRIPVHTSGVHAHEIRRQSHVSGHVRHSEGFLVWRIFYGPE